LKGVVKLRTGKSFFFSITLVAASVAVSLAFAEVFLRIKNASMRNYDIEMWRYSKELKVRIDDPAIDFVHARSKSAVLESVEIRLNTWGLRGREPTSPLPTDRRILFLGGSITLGWGVKEDDTVQVRLEKMLKGAGRNAEVLNGGVANYNTERYVSRFFRELTELKPTDIVVQYFLRDAEDLAPGIDNFLLRHSQLAITLWIAYQRLVDQPGEKSLEEYYRRVYQSSAPGFLKMKAHLKRLADYAKQQGVNIYLAMTPDVHNLTDYKLSFVHELAREVAGENGYIYIDLLPAMLRRTPQELFVMPGDPHPNGLGHELMANAIFPVIAAQTAALAK
jgi:lysophospholipase L1-like esterase